MNMQNIRLIVFCIASICGVCSLFYALWTYTPPITQNRTNSAVSAANIVAYCEIPVLDMERATRFYSTVLGVDFTRQMIDGNEMALFPFGKNATGASGALAKGEIYKPSTTGTLVYLRTKSIDMVLSKAVEMGGKVLYPKTSVGENSFVAEFLDLEGNRIALISERRTGGK